MFADAYTTLYANYAKLAAYDIVILQCEGSQLESMKKPYLANIRRYADTGGRIFDEHLHSYWIAQGLPPWPSTAAWLQAIDKTAVTTSDVDYRYVVPQGGGARRLAAVRPGDDDARADQSHRRPSTRSMRRCSPTQRWIYTPADSHTQYLTFNTPVEAPEANQCGRVVFTDLHVGSGGGVLALRHAVPDRLLDVADHVRPGKGAGVHVLRPVVVRAARERAADADPDSVMR